MGGRLLLQRIRERLLPRSGRSLIHRVCAGRDSRTTFAKFLSVGSFSFRYRGTNCIAARSDTAELKAQTARGPSRLLSTLSDAKGRMRRPNARGSRVSRSDMNRGRVPADPALGTKESRTISFLCLGGGSSGGESRRKHLCSDTRLSRRGKGEGVPPGRPYRDS